MNTPARRSVSGRSVGAPFRQAIEAVFTELEQPSGNHRLPQPVRNRISHDLGTAVRHHGHGVWQPGRRPVAPACSSPVIQLDGAARKACTVSSWSTLRARTSWRAFGPRNSLLRRCPMRVAGALSTDRGELLSLASSLERHYRDVQDVELTVERRTRCTSSKRAAPSAPRPPSSVKISRGLRATRECSTKEEALKPCLDPDDDAPAAHAPVCRQRGEAEGD